MKKYLKLARISHWIKNVLIILPVFFSGRLLESEALQKSLTGVLAFCFISSVIYIINDINDAEKDKNHETKKKRPIASGAVSVKSAAIFAGVLFVLSAALCAFACGSNTTTYFYPLAYLVINLFYSGGGKNLPIVDVAILVSGFIIRVLFGAAVTGIEISNWLYLTVIAAAFYMSLGKRRNELDKSGGGTREVLKYYSYGFLDKMMYVFMAVAIVFYSLWCTDPVTAGRFRGAPMIWSVPVVILICMRYSLIIEGDSHGDPVEVILKDKSLFALTALYAALLFGLMYL